MAVSNVTVCNQDRIRVLNGLPDAPYPVNAILTENTISVKVIYHADSPKEPARIDASVAARKLGCFPSDLLVLEWDGDLERTFGGTPWIKDIFDTMCITCNDDEPVHIVDDFGDLF